MPNAHATGIFISPWTENAKLWMAGGPESSEEKPPGGPLLTRYRPVGWREDPRDFPAPPALSSALA